MSEPFRHDYTRKTYKSGWAIVRFDFLDAERVKVSAFGYKRQGSEQTRILPGEEIVLTMPDGEALYEIITITYHHNPSDMYQAELKYVQHLNGLKAVYWRDEQKNARAIAWGQKNRVVASDDQPSA